MTLHFDSFRFPEGLDSQFLQHLSSPERGRIFFVYGYLYILSEIKTVVFVI